MADTTASASAGGAPQAEQRATQIFARANSLGVPFDKAREIVESGVGLDAALGQLIDAWHAQGPGGATSAAPATSRVSIVRDEDETEREALVGALQAQMFNRKPEGPAARFRGLTPRKLATYLAEKNGVSGMAVSEYEAVRAGLMSRGAIAATPGRIGTSDFNFITADSVNRELRAQYEATQPTWMRIASRRTTPTFRSIKSVQLSADTVMKEVDENGEYQATVIGDVGETFTVKRYGRKIHLTFEMIINDDLGAVQRLPAELARGARNLESTICWGLIRSNPNLSDGNAFFSAAHGNIETSGGSITVDTVGAGVEAMLQQLAEGAPSGSDDYVTAEPDLLVVPNTLATEARQFVRTISPEQVSSTNPYSGLEVLVEPRLNAASGGSDDGWYLFDSRLPAMEYAYLEGFEAPTVETVDYLDPKGTTMIAEHIFGAGLTEYRGAYYNDGVT